LCSFCAFIGFLQQFGGGSQTRGTDRKIGKNRAFTLPAKAGKKQAVLRWKMAKKGSVQEVETSPSGRVFSIKREGK
jgi:hypothetical protein